jgi:hypothetical protein
MGPRIRRVEKRPSSGGTDAENRQRRGPTSLLTQIIVFISPYTAATRPDPPTIDCQADLRMSRERGGADGRPPPAMTWSHAGRGFVGPAGVRRARATPPAAGRGADEDERQLSSASAMRRMKRAPGRAARRDDWDSSERARPWMAGKPTDRRW